jgi:hypothetical protein
MIYRYFQEKGRAHIVLIDEEDTKAIKKLLASGMYEELFEWLV